jgi:pimeloyl-ACP methyl ester carboxylesterase
MADNEKSTGIPWSSGPSRRTALRGLAATAGGAALAASLGGGTAHATGTADGVRTYVLVHGTHSAAAFWTAIGRELALRGHRVVAVDQPFLISEQE